MSNITAINHAQGAEAAGLRKSIRLPELVVYGLLFIAPTGLAGLFGPLYTASEGALGTVFIVAMVIMGFTVFSYAAMARAVPAAGSVYAYASAGLGSRWGFVGGWMMLLDYVLIPSIAYLFAGFAMHSALPALAPWAWTAIFVVATTACNLMGVKFAARVGLIVAALELVVVGLVVILGLVAVGQSGPRQPFSLAFVGEHGLTVGLIAAAVSIAVFSFLGFDGIAAFSEENAGSPKHVGRAMYICLVLAGAVLVGLSVVAVVITPLSPSELAAQPSGEGTAFYDAIRATIAPWLAVVFALIKAFGSAFAAMVGQSAASRLMFAMAREGNLPKVLARVSGRSGVPWFGIAALGVLSFVIAVGASLTDNGLDLLSSTINIGALVGFVLVHASVVGYYLLRRKERRWLSYGVIPAVGIVFTLILIVSSSLDAKIVGLVWLAIGVVIALMRVRGKQTPAAPVAASGEEARA